jgi:hypothetical protein
MGQHGQRLNTGTCFSVSQLFILSYYDAVSFRDIRGHLGKIPSITTFYIHALVVEGDYSRVTRRNPGEYKSDQLVRQKEECHPPFIMEYLC